MDFNLINKMIEEGYVTVQTHGLYPLSIYNYSKTAAYDQVWNEATLNCRGLIVNNETGEVVARPFRKFFNLEELTIPLPNEPFEVYEKMDGSLGILYWYGDKAAIATRGSFISEQSQVATELLNTKYKHLLPHLNRDYTYLFEILYPENRIVVDYNGLRDIVLIGVIDTKTGKDVSLDFATEQIRDGLYAHAKHAVFPVVKRFDGVEDFNELKSVDRDNFEGYVIKFVNGFRVKVKLEEYCRLHRIVTGVSNKTVWEYLREGRMFDELVDRVPDEFYKWLHATKDNLEKAFKDIEDFYKLRFEAAGDMPDRKSWAEYFLKFKTPSILFCMLDNKSYDDIIWKMVKPKFEKPFSNQSSEEA